MEGQYVNIVIPGRKKTSHTLWGRSWWYCKQSITDTTTSQRFSAHFIMAACLHAAAAFQPPAEHTPTRI